MFHNETVIVQLQEKNSTKLWMVKSVIFNISINYFGSAYLWTEKWSSDYEIRCFGLLTVSFLIKAAKGLWVNHFNLPSFPQQEHFSKYILTFWVQIILFPWLFRLTRRNIYFYMKHKKITELKYFYCFSTF